MDKECFKCPAIILSDLTAFTRRHGALVMILLVGVARIAIQRDLVTQRRADEHMRLVLESTPAGIVMINRAGIITLVNAQSEHLFGYTRAEVIGLSVDKLVPERFRAGHPEHRARFFSDPHARLMGGGRELDGLCKDGREVPIEIGLNPLKTPDGDFVLASVVDISARKEMEDALRRVHAELEERIRERTLELQEANVALHDSEQRMRLAIEATEVGIWEWNVITNRIRWGAQMFRLYGILPTPDGVVDYSDWTGAVAPEDLRQQEEALQDTVRRLGSSLREFRIRRRKDGRRCRTSYAHRLIRSSVSPVLFCSGWRDR